MTIVIGGQAGSESKGKLSAHVAQTGNADLIVMAASCNAGHTVVLPDDTKKVSYHLPIASVVTDCPVILGPASLINLKSFAAEIEDLGIDPSRITVDSRASVITPQHIKSEVDGSLSDIGSTLQGIGECRRGKMRRKGRADHTLAQHVTDVLTGMGVSVMEQTPALVNDFLFRGARVLCETTQGFDLDLEHGIDPVYCTSKMINPSMAAAEAGVSPHLIGDVIGVIRPYPIRVNNRTGTSGPYAEAGEITWDVVKDRCGCPDDLEEITTTTKLPRRVFEFSWSRFEHFLRVCRPTAICLQFANYLDWSVFNSTNIKSSVPVLLFINQIDAAAKEMGLDCRVKFVGTGPGTKYMVEL